MKKYGLTGIGAIPYMTNFNVTLKDGIDLEIGKKVAAKIRNSNPDGTGCLGVQSMAFNHIENRIEIACNVELLEYDPSNFRHIEVYTYETCKGGGFAYHLYKKILCLLYFIIFLTKFKRRRTTKKSTLNWLGVIS